jgi:ribosomal protein S18 acetylase RimI-like enzyme
MGDYCLLPKFGVNIRCKSAESPAPMSGVRIRDAARSDLDGLAALENRSFTSDRMARRGLRRLIGRPTARLRVAAERLSGGRVLIRGYHLVLLRKGSRVARVYSIAVDRPARGAGLGKRLLADAEDVAARAGRHRLRLEVRARNRAAIAFYERQGYGRIGRYRNYYADGSDALRYEKPLTGSADTDRGKQARG